MAINLRKVKLDKDVDLTEIAAMLEGYSGADITIVCRLVVLLGLFYDVYGIIAICAEVYSTIFC